ncbi:PAS domain-containing protein [Rhodoferax aquaticus]|nr:PAS domain-containing protein [Rhodoferax aquaticus]
MQSAAIPANEAARLATLKGLDVLDTGPEEEFDALIKVASLVCGVPISLISLVDTERQWFKANIGLPGVSETPRDLAFCAHAILGDEVFEVPDALQDPRFADNPLVASQPDIRFYAGAPILMTDGQRIGTLCVIDRQARALSDAQREILRCLALAAAQALEGRRAMRVSQAALAALAESEGRMRALHDSSPMGIYHANVRGECTYTNPHWQSIYGLSGEQSLGHQWLTVVHPDDLAQVRQAMRTAAVDQEIYTVDYRVLRPDGTVRYVTTLARTVNDEAGSRIGYVGTVQDITERHERDEALRKTQSMLNRTAMVAGTGGWEVDLQEGSIFWSEQTCLIHGVEPGYQPTMEEATAFYPPGAREQVEHAVQVAMQGGPGFDLELPFVPRGQPSIWVRAVGQVEFVNGQPVRLVGAFQDVTQARAARLALAQAQERVRLATTSGGIGIWDLDLVTGELLWDAQLSALYGLDFAPRRADYALWAGLVHPEDVSQADALIQESLQTGKLFNHEFRVVWPDTTVHHLKAFGRVQMDEYGKAVSMVGTNWDVTEAAQYAQSLQEARDKAEVASQSKSQFLANMSHEIRTPMNAILGMLSLVQRTELDAQQLDYVRKTEGAAKSLLGLLNDILDFSKVDAGKMSLELRPMRPEQLLRDLAVVLSGNTGKKDVEIVFDIDPALPEVLVADALRLQQVLTNLGGNAMKFTAAGSVVVSVQVVPSLANAAQAMAAERVRIEFAVEDSGIGIAPEHQAHIFSAFSQAEASTTRRFGGTGLGLAISQRMVDLMGGTLQVRSALGQGSRFSFEVEFAVPAQVPDELVLPARQSMEARRVLLVDDNTLARRSVAKTMRSWGWEVDEAESGIHALALTQQTGAAAVEYALLLVDWHLPGMDGWELVRQLRGQVAGQRGKGPTFLMLSAQGRDHLAQRTLDEQKMIHGLLAKPLTESLLWEAIADASTGQTRMRQAVRAGSSARQLQGMRILVVEDNLLNQQVAEELLTAQGALVSLAGNGQLGVEAVLSAEPQFDVVLMDVQMPVLDGYDATRAIRQHAQWTSLPIVAMTANAMDSDRQACIDAGMNAHIGKPFDMGHLVHTLIQLTGFVAQPAAAVVSLPAQGHAETANGNLTEVDGVDLAPAIARMGGLRGLYVRTARDFSAELADVAQTLRQHVHSHAFVQASMLLHTLKGNAGTLGLRDLAQIAGQWETHSQSMRAADDFLPAQWLELDATLARAAGQLRQAIELLEPAASLAAMPAQPDGQTSAQVALQDLQALLLKEDYAVLERYAELRQQLSSLSPQTQDALAQALQDLDFGQALAVCESALA